MVSLARSWINSCCKSHPECLPPAFYRPKRLVHIISATKASIILTDYAQIENSSYTALSHCWGKGVPLKLTRESEAILTQPFNITDLPPTFQDAVRFTSALGYSYIWIDSLCIIQDSPEDWAAQSILMSEIYAGAICTIAATDASDSQNGCFRDRSPLPEYSFECVLMGSPDAYAFIRTAGGEFPNIESLFSTSVENAPLNQRAWTFQERLLSGRVVHFCKSIVLFECHSMRTSELHPADGVHCERETWISYDAIVNKNESRKSRKLQPQYMRSFYGTAELMSSLGDRLVGKKLISRPTRLGIRGALNMLLSLTEELSLNDKIRCHQDWYELVAEYSRRDTTFRSDRLVALAGLATLISSKTGMNCVSGLWNATLPLDLLWVPMLTSQARPSTSIAPSWSWASVDGGVRSLFSDFFIGPDWNIKTKAMVNSVKAEYPCSTLPIAKHVELLVEGPMKMYKPDQLHSTFDFNDTPYDIELACLLIHSCSPGYMAYMEGGGQCLLLRHKESYEDHENAYERVGTVVIPSEEARPENGWETKVIILV